jgi:hypothetical protein
MSEIENQMKPILKPMIEGEQVQLDLAQQIDLATWATLKAFVYERIANDPPVATQAERDLLRSQRRPPGNVRAFLACAGNGTVFGVYRAYVEGWKEKDGESKFQRFYGTTFRLGHLLVQVIGNPDSDYRPFELPGIANDQAQTILPPVEGSVWPPKYVLSDAAIDEFAKAHMPRISPN